MNSLKAFLHYIAKKGSLKGFKITKSEVVSLAFSGLVDGVLSSSRLKRNAQAVAGQISQHLFSILRIENEN